MKRSKKDRVFYKIMIDITRNILEAAQIFRENVENMGSLKEIRMYAERIKDLELKGDEYTHLLIRELNLTFVTPLDHEDIFKLASCLDDVLDGIEACAARFLYFHVDHSTPSLIRFADNLLECAEHLHHAFISLEKRDYDAIREVSVKINLLENEADKLMRESISALFEPPINILELIKMKEIYERLEYITDAFEDVMDIMESVVMKYA